MKSAKSGSYYQAQKKQVGQRAKNPYRTTTNQLALLLGDKALGDKGSGFLPGCN